jgi:hypothetical protein
MDINNDNNTKLNDFPEAKASWNVRYLSPEGYECMLTLRAENGSELLERASCALAYLLANACIPSTYYRNGARSAGSNANEQKKSEETSNVNGNDKNNSSLSWCPIHQVEMKAWSKDGRTWFSHKIDGGWCRGKQIGV